MRKLIVAGVAALAVAAAGTIATAPDADAASRGYSIAKEPTKKASAAKRKVRMPRAGTPLRREAARLNNARYLPGDACSRWAYRGVALVSRTNGVNVWSIRSKVAPKRFHVFRNARDVGTVRKGKRVTCPAQERIDRARKVRACRKQLAAFPRGRKIGLSYVYADTDLRCDSAGRLTVRGPDLPEDAYGWNCFRDGNGACDLPKVDGSCRIDHRDGYTMCPNGRVYIRGSKNGKTSRTHLVYRVLS